jgi:NAD(P)-dependent dehydrogenase (short-subunit alcohol dehydrogenase family)
MSNQKIALITGGDKGIGKGIVEVLAEEGYRVFFTYRNNIEDAKQIENKYHKVSSLQFDAGDKNSIAHLIDDLSEMNITIDILINNVGIDRDAVFYKMNFDSWYEVIYINLVQIFHLTKAFVPGMILKSWGRIINISSIGAFQGSYGKTNYAASKAGIIGFSKALALELANKGITVNTICPGAFDTSMFRRIPEKYRDIIISQIPMKRLGNPKEIGYLVKYLISNEASYMTGQTLHLNGGWFFG